MSALWEEGQELMLAVFTMAAERYRGISLGLSGPSTGVVRHCGPEGRIALAFLMFHPSALSECLPH